MNSLFRKLGWLARRRDKEEQLAAEMRFHLEEEAEARQAQGVNQQEASLAARRDLGNMGMIKEDARAAWGWTWVEQLFQDLRYAARTMAHNPAFTLLAALSLALGIGANTAIYSFMDALMVRSLPVENPASLAVLNWHGQSAPGVMHDVSGNTYDDRKYGRTARIFPYPAFELFQKSDAIFSSLFAYYPTRNLNLVIQGQAEIGSGQFVSGEYFHGLEVMPEAGRLLLPDDDRAGAPAVVVLASGFSQRHFGDAARAVGQSILINNVPFTVTGIAPPDFFGVDPSMAPAFYLPIHANLLLDPNLGPRGMARRYLDGNDYWVEMMGRLRPDVSRMQAQAALATLFHEWVRTTATNQKERTTLPALHLTSGATGIDTLRRRYSEPLYVLLAMVGLILAIACANIANLLLARAAARRREMAVRLSMGAGRWRVIRQLLTESVLLASLGGALGILFALWGVRSLSLLLANGRDDFTLHAELNWRVLAVAAGLSILTGLLFGLIPALQGTRVEVMPVLKETRTGGRRPRFRFLRFALSHALMVSQIAISLLLVVAAGLFVRSLSNLQSVELGFDRQNILLFKLNARQAGHRDPEILSFYSDLRQRFAAIPGVRSVALANSPLIGDGTWVSPVVPLGKPQPENAPDGHGSGAPASSTHILSVGPGFFSAMKIGLAAGREFDERDRPNSRPVAIVNEAWVKVNLADQNPMGQHIVLKTEDGSSLPQEMEIIGIAKNAHYGDLTEAFPATVYVAFRQNLYRAVDEMTYALRTSGDPLALTNTVREMVHQADARVPVMKLSTQSAMIDQAMTGEIMFARLCTVFAALALGIACVGLYGTLSYMVAQRTGEIGIRMALGARRATVIWMVLRQILVMAIIGLAIGLPAAYGSSRLLESFLFGIKANDPATIAIAAGTLVLAALLAGYAPARRASRIDPIAALRHE